MKTIIFVPGKNPKPPASLHKQQLLRCLLHGIRTIDSEVADEIERTEAFSLVAWNYLFYHIYIDINRITPWVDRLLEQPVILPHDIRSARPLRYRLSKLLYVMADYLPLLIPLIPDRRIKLSIQDTERYFINNDNIGCRIRELQKAPLRDAVAGQHKVLLIGHSMGSVIAYDSLWELDHLEGISNCVDTLLTIGSPLGMNYVQKRLFGKVDSNTPTYPRNIRTWINVSARGDLVALDPVLANDFGTMITRGCIENISDMGKNIYNHYRDEKGLNVHKSYGYLVNPVISRVIADWWRAA